MKKYVLAAVLALASANAIAENWVEVLKDDPVFLYADLDSIKQEGKITKMQLRMEMPALSVVKISDEEFDCSKRMVLDQSSKNWMPMTQTVATKKSWEIACHKE